MKESALVTRPVSAASEDCKYQCFSQGLVEQLVSVYRTMFPHSAVPDEFYEHVVRKLDDQAVHDHHLSGLLFNGVEALNRRAGCAMGCSLGRGQAAGASTSRADPLLSKAPVGLCPLLLQ